MAIEKKYQNHAQLVQGVSQVDDDTLTLSERCFLNCLAAYSVVTCPHPGYKKLARACGVKSKQAVRKIAERLIERRGLIEILELGNGRTHATVYRIRTEDPRFPPPKGVPVEIPLSSDKGTTDGSPLSTAKGTTGEAERGNWEPGKGQLADAKGTTLELPTDVLHGVKYTDVIHETAAGAADVEPDDFYEPSDQERIQRYFEIKAKLEARGDQVAIGRLNAAYREILDRARLTTTPSVPAPLNEEPRRSIMCSRCSQPVSLSEYASHVCQPAAKAAR